PRPPRHLSSFPTRRSSDLSAAEKQLAKLDRLKKTRNADQVARSLDALRAAARSTENLMPRILDAVCAYATVGEMCDALRDVWGEDRKSTRLNSSHVKISYA